MKVIDEDKDGIEVLLWKGATVSDLMENKSYTFRSLSMNKSSKYGKQLYSTDETCRGMNDFYDNLEISLLAAKQERVAEGENYRG